MKPRRLVASIFVLISTLSLPAGATVLTFDDLNSNSTGIVPNSYAGLTFNNWWHIDTPPYSYPYTSAPTVIYNSEDPYTNAPEILFGQTVDVLSVYLADFSSVSVTLHGYLGATELFTTTVFPNSSFMTQYTLSFTGIDSFVMQTTDGEYAFMDNLEYKVTAVPEPETYALFMAGLGLMGFIARRRKNSQA